MRSFRLLFLLPLSACASASGAFEPLPSNHPANPHAAAAPISDPAPFLRADGALPQAAATTPPASTAAYVCSMHPEVGSEQPGSCSKCGMKLVPRAQEHPHGG